MTASMWAAPLSWVLVSALPKSKQQPELTWVPLATMYMPSALAVDRDPGGAVIPVAGLPVDVEAVLLVAADRDRQRGRVGADVRPGRAARALDGQVVAPPGLVVELGDHAVGVRAEDVLLGGVPVAAGREQPDVGGGAVRGALDLVQRPVVGGVERAHGAVGGHARRAGGGVDVTGIRSGRLRGRGYREHSEAGQGDRRDRGDQSPGMAKASSSSHWRTSVLRVRAQ